MIALLEQIKHGQVWDFHGGIHPPENKRQSSEQSIIPIAIPNEIVLPLKQHIGSAGQVLVNVGDRVLKGQPLTKSDSLQSCPVHAPTSGEVVAIESRTIAHASGLSDTCLVIRPDDEDQWGDKSPIDNFQDTAADELVDHVRMMGIAGMGGAGFPSARKLQTGLARTEILIINGAECEPYITADDRLMQEHADEIIQGVEILQHIVQPKLAVLALEDNKPEAIAALKHAIGDKKNIIVQVVPTKYPSGGEKQLIKLITGKEVPAKGIPAAIGVLMQNIGTVHAIKRAIIDGEPLIQRVVTLTGTTLEEQRNRWVLLGTPVRFLLEKHGYKQDKRLERLIIGGPMMGFTVPHADVPVTKVTNCVLVPSRREIAPSQGEMACIRCSACAEACPASLLPQQLQWYAKDQDFDKCEEYNLFDCIECGACAYVCPSEIPLVQYYRQAKAEIRHRNAEAVAAERARERFEAKKMRMEREKEKREARHKEAAENRRKAMEKSGDGDAIAAAIARVKAKSEQGSAATAVKPAVAAAIAKAKAKQAEAAASGQAEPDNSEMKKLREERKRQARERKAEQAAQAETSNVNASESATDVDPKKAAVAAAIARAKARKDAQQADAPQAEKEESAADVDPKKAAVAAAIARAKARKEAQQADTPQTSEDESTADVDPKKAAVAAAIARAKARKAAQQAEAPTETNNAPAEPETVEPVVEDIDPKKAAVAAAVARAKARKAAQQAEAAETDNASAESETVEPVAEDIDPKKAAVAAAVARAKARKAAQEAEAPTETDNASAEPESVEPVVEDIDPKKAAVAAAVARAKARKAAQQAEAAETDNASAEPETVEPVAEDIDPKKAAVAAAIARAKARKAAQMKKNNEDK